MVLVNNKKNWPLHDKTFFQSANFYFLSNFNSSTKHNIKNYNSYKNKDTVIELYYV